MNLGYLQFKTIVKGILLKKEIPYTPILEDGDSTPYFGAYEGQKYGKYDTSCCWDFSATEIIETRLAILEKKGMIPKEHLDWLIENGYKDKDGDYYLSRRWVAILAGVKDNGNYQQNFWDIVGNNVNAGMIPNWMLPYSAEDAFDEYDQNDFNNEYFDQNKITQAMEEMGREFAKRFKIMAEPIGKDWTSKTVTEIMTYLKEGSIQIGIPVPQDGSWNQKLINFPKGRIRADHAVELAKFDPIENRKYPYYIYDSYKPSLKQLSSDYYIPIATRIVILPIQLAKPIDNKSYFYKFWLNVKTWLSNKPLPYPAIPIGRS